MQMNGAAMRKITAIILSIVIVFSLFGCTEQKHTDSDSRTDQSSSRMIEGTPSDVIEECNDLENNEEATVIVSGYIVYPGVQEVESSDSDSDFVYLLLSDDKAEIISMYGSEPLYDVSEQYVDCLFEDEESFNKLKRLSINDYITVIGHAYPEIVYQDNITIFDCVIVE